MRRGFNRKLKLLQQTGCLKSEFETFNGNRWILTLTLFTHISVRCDCASTEIHMQYLRSITLYCTGVILIYALSYYAVFTVLALQGPHRYVVPYINIVLVLSTMCLLCKLNISYAALQIAENRHKIFRLTLKHKHQTEKCFLVIPGSIRSTQRQYQKSFRPMIQGKTTQSQGLSQRILLNDIKCLEFLYYCA